MGCDATTIHLDSLVDTFKITSCSSTKIVMDGKVPSIVMEKTDGAVIYLSSESLEVEIITSCSSMVKVMMPEKEEKHKFVETPHPSEVKDNYPGKGAGQDCGDG